MNAIQAIFHLELPVY